MVQEWHGPENNLPSLIAIGHVLKPQRILHEGHIHETLGPLFMGPLQQLSIDTVTVHRTLPVTEHRQTCQGVGTYRNLC
jgi:hypothetical protein